MSRTIRRDREDNKFPEGLKKRKAWYSCRCSYCTGFDKRHKEEVIADKELKKELDYINNPDPEWERIRAFWKKGKETVFDEWDWEQEYWAKQEEAA